MTDYVRIPVALSQGWQSWQATVGAVSENGTTKTKALANLAESISTGLRRYEPPALVQYGGLSAVVHFGPAGELTYRVHADGQESGWTHMTGDTIAEGKRAALCSMVQRVTDWHDDASVWRGHDALSAAGDDYGAADHLRYAGWQRAYREATETLRGDITADDFHRYATMHARELTPVRAAQAHPIARTA
jgi:hypothetical protein